MSKQAVTDKDKGTFLQWRQRPIPSAYSHGSSLLRHSLMMSWCCQDLQSVGQTLSHASCEWGSTLHGVVFLILEGRACIQAQFRSALTVHMLCARACLHQVCWTLTRVGGSSKANLAGQLLGHTVEEHRADPSTVHSTGSLNLGDTQHLLDFQMPPDLHLQFNLVKTRNVHRCLERCFNVIIHVFLKLAVSIF